MPSNAEPRDCAQCGTPYRNGNPTHRTCGSPRCKAMQRDEQRRNHWTRSHARKREKKMEEKRASEAMAARLRAVANTNPVISDELGRRTIVARMRQEMELGFTEMSCVAVVAREVNETPATVISVWKSVQK